MSNPLIIQAFENLDDMVRSFPTEESCMQHLEKIRWPFEVVSPFDEYSKVYRCSAGRFRCRNTGKYFNAKTYTVFHNTKIELIKWFKAIWLVSNEKNMTAAHLSSRLDVTHKTSWLMFRKIVSVLEMEKSRTSVPKKAPAQMVLTDWLSKLR